MSKNKVQDLSYNSFMDSSYENETTPFTTEELDPGNKGGFNDSWNTIYHFCYDSTRKEYTIDNKELEDLCDKLNQNTPEFPEFGPKGNKGGKNDHNKTLDEKIAEYRNQGHEPDYRNSVMGRTTSITLLFSPVTKTTIENFLKDLVNLRLSLEMKKIEEFERKRKSSSFRISDEYSSIPETTTLESYQEKLNRKVSILKKYEKYIPMAIILLICSLTAYTIFGHHMGPIQASIILFILLMSVGFLVCFYFYKYFVAKKKIDELKTLGLSTLGMDPKIVNIVYRFNKARLTSRNSKVMVSQDCDIVSFEVDLSVNAERDEEVFKLAERESRTLNFQ